MLTWKEVLEKEKKKPYFLGILNTISEEIQSGITIYPPKKDIFNAFRFTEFSNINVVILGQDPYIGPKQACGLAFAVRYGISIPPSLRNIYKELERSIPGFKIPVHGYLEKWSRQGVFLLNTILTVRAGETFSHARIGWNIFTDKVISLINKYHKGVVFLLWGAHSQKKKVLIDKNCHHVLSAPHPSPISSDRGFIGCNHFVLTNQYLKNCGKKLIDWTLISNRRTG